MTVFKPKKGKGTKLGSLRKILRGLRQGQKELLKQKGQEEGELIKNLEVTQTLEDVLDDCLKRSPYSNIFEEWVRLISPAMLGQILLEEDVE